MNDYKFHYIFTSFVSTDKYDTRFVKKITPVYRNLVRRCVLQIRLNIQTLPFKINNNLYVLKFQHLRNGVFFFIQID